MIFKWTIGQFYQQEELTCLDSMRMYEGKLRDEPVSNILSHLTDFEEIYVVSDSKLHKLQ